MALPATDSFTRGPASTVDIDVYSANWTQDSSTGDFKVDGTTDNVWSDKTEGSCHWNADSFDNDQYAEIVIVSSSSGNWHGVSVRADTGGANTYYGFYGDSSSQYLFEQIAGSWTEISSTGNGFSASDVVRLEVDGTSLSALVNDSEEESASGESGISSGAAGLSSSAGSSTPRMDDWEGGNLAAGPAAVVQDVIGRGLIPTAR
jgi:hypothetical protein